jgi:RNA polymerase sigma factor (sigma-70 family)
MSEPVNVRSHRYVAALVVGTALSTLGLAPAEASSRAIQDVSRYCTTCWRNARLQPDFWLDCTQDVLARLLDRVELPRWNQLLEPDTQERRELIRAIDAVKKRTQRAHRPAQLSSEPADGRIPFRQDRSEQREAVLRAADMHLSQRQSRIISLSLDGWSVAEIAQALNLPTTRVSDEKYKAIQRLRKELLSDAQNT